MTAQELTLFDGHMYEKGATLPDIGSFNAVSVSGSVRNYEGLSKDVTKLPKYQDLGNGSSAYCIDTAQLYKYDAENKIWIEQ